MAPESGYGDMRHVREELEWSRQVFEKHPAWTVLDITGKAIEETASSLLERYRAQFESGQGNGSGAASPAAPRTKA